MKNIKAEALTKWCFVLAAYPDFDDVEYFMTDGCSYCDKYGFGDVTECNDCPLDNWICGDVDSLYDKIYHTIIRDFDRQSIKQIKQMIEKMIIAIEDSK